MVAIAIRASTRQRRIMELLLDRKREITAADIAEVVGASARTVHRELRDIERMLEAGGIKLRKTAGLGIKVEAAPETLERFRAEIRRNDPLEYTAEERKVLILCRLLEYGEPAKLFALASELRVTMPTIGHDLDELEEIIAKQGLVLIRRRGYGVEIDGPETAKRGMISLLAYSHLDDSDVFGQYKDQAIVHPVTARLLGMVGKESFMKLEQAMWELGDEWQTGLSETAYTRLLVKLSVAFTRIAQGHLIPQGGTDAEAGRSDDAFLNRLLAALDMQLPAAEKRYVADLLAQAEKPEEALLASQDDRGAIETVTELIRYVQNGLHMPLLQDRSLAEGLIRHIKPAFRRIRDGIAIRNPMLAPIKKDYGALFALVRRGVNELVRDMKVPDEEIGYIVMHFGASLERLGQYPRKIKAVLVCTSGIGSSKLLAVRIAKELPQIELIGHYSWYEAARMPASRYDLIISTVDLPLGPDQYVKLSPLLTREETNTLRSFIESTTLKKLRSADDAGADRDGESPMNRLMQLQLYSADVLRLLDGFRAHDLTVGVGEAARLESLLPRMIGLLGRPDADENGGKIASQLIARERQGSLVIPDSELALIHSRSEWIREPLLALYRFDVPVSLSEDESAKARQVLMMLGPAKPGKYSLEILSEISAMLLLPDMIEVLSNGDEAGMKTFISRKLEHYIKTKLDWRG
ncbi:BglG family transcription antiterminator [Paenibacillus arenilitoris]|uniref:BglG family transcription antiterminator n=1 Tax=Paenibacillus arenilitoris TaxID=2772299 RepID=A0A927CVR2_9BACL|nr:BglG family transcription antiterminator [Paenibacillus arenilitoris]MBD2872425.1 BglG family transcription antiterminator [Paenibacillus arenilitoris]